MFKRKFEDKDAYSELVTLNAPYSVMSEEFRTLRTNIQFSMFDQSFKTLVVTSSISGEGKSTVASNLASVFASQGKKVVLVDADLRKPSIHVKFNLSNDRGLTSFLIGTEPSLSYITGQPYHKNLYILTSGLVPPNPSELLASQKMTTFIDKLKEEFDLIIFDAPPVTVVTDAAILASIVDGTVFVVRNGVADRNMLIKSKELLDKVHANIVGTVFNRKKEIKEKEYNLYNVER